MIIRYLTRKKGIWQMNEIEATQSSLKQRVIQNTTKKAGDASDKSNLATTSNSPVSTLTKSQEDEN